MRALVLEDNDRIVELYKKIFSQKKYEVDFVSDTASCLDSITGQTHGYDFVVLEKPTKLDNHANLEDQIREASPKQKVFFLSPYMTQRDKGFESVKATLDLVDKPFALITLLSYLEIKPVQQ
jgi:DNA-binding response OmpR family regulator